MSATARDTLPIGSLVKLGYELILGRPADSAGLHHYASLLESGSLSRTQFIYTLCESVEFQAPRCSEALHRARLRFIQQLPRAQTIVDLGGGCPGKPEGALLVMGYPHSFRELWIVEPPREQRHAIYAEVCAEHQEPVATRQGLVKYVYRPMWDLGCFADNSVDLVFSGESLEHVSLDQGRKVVQEAFRVLRPGGYFCLDTPNRAVTKLQCPDSWINPDHKHEYTHPELAKLLAKAGFSVRDATGLCRMVRSTREKRFISEECLLFDGLHEDIANCYLLAYQCQKPVPGNA